MLHKLILFGPESALVFFLVMLFFIDAILPKSREGVLPLLISLAGLFAAGILTWQGSGTNVAFFHDLVVADSLSHFFRYLFFFTAALALWLGYGSKEIEKDSRVEFCILVLCITFGLCLMALAKNLLVFYIGLETVSIVSFALAGFKRHDLKSNEASLKYLIFGAFASAAMLYGFSFLYGYAGSLNYDDLAKYFRDQGGVPAIVLFSLALSYLGIAYKISSFPMHFWTPDVYQGAPISVAAFFSVGPKAAGFAALIRLLLTVFSFKVDGGKWGTSALQFLPNLLAVIAAISMFVGNLSALNQNSVKRILAYSSIAHVGYLLMGLATFSNAGFSSVLFYILVYCAMNLGAFWVVSVVSDVRGGDRLEDFSAMGWRSPVLGVSMAIFLFSLTGLPFFAGFIGKFLLFGAVVQTPGLMWLALVGIFNSVVSLFYYVRILKAMWLERTEESEGGAVALAIPWHQTIGIVGLAIPTVIIGLFFYPIVRFAQAALAIFTG